MFKKLFAICLLVEDFDKSFVFYKDNLGLEVNSVSGKFADFKLEGTSLAIFQQADAVAMFPKEYMKKGGGCVHAFQVESIEESVKTLESKGVIFFEKVKTTAWGQKVAYFLDPDNNIWEISEK